MTHGYYHKTILNNQFKFNICENDEELGPEIQTKLVIQVDGNYTKAGVAIWKITHRYMSKEDRKSHRAINVEVAAKLDWWITRGALP